MGKNGEKWVKMWFAGPKNAPRLPIFRIFQSKNQKICQKTSKILFFYGQNLIFLIGLYFPQCKNPFSSVKLSY